MRGAERPVMTTADAFYRYMAPVSSFENVADVQSYQAVPDDWVIVLADIEGSTQQIEAGRYKTVNLIGAAVITAVLNALPGLDVPYVFGGDGAALVVPPGAADAARSALAALKRHAREMFDLELRAGSVAVAAVRVVGFDVRVMKLDLGAGNALAMFSGGGIATANAWLSQALDNDPLLIEPAESGAPPLLDGLSCRWQPLRARRGVVLSLITCARTAGPEAELAHVKRVMAALRDILGQDIAAAAPIGPEVLAFRWPPAGLDLETRATAGRKWQVRRRAEILLQSLIQYVCERFNMRIGYYDAPSYRTEMINQTDFQKYDDMVRLVLDVTMDEAARIDMFLRAEHGAGQLFFGTHHSRDALMTCLVFSLEHSRHVHFIDGAEGGFALAARELKRQIANTLQGKAAS
jgi:hypothetical protein